MPVGIGSSTATGATQVTTFYDLYTDLQNRVRVTTSVSATEVQAKRYINIALQDMHLAFDYKLPWAERTALLRTQAPYITGTVSVDVGSTTVTGVGTTWNTLNSYEDEYTHVGGKIIFPGTSDIYTVATRESDTTLTLNTRYVGGSDLVDSPYIYFEDTYALALDFLRPVDVQYFAQDTSIPVISRPDFRRMYPRPKISGRPKVACLLDMPFTDSATPSRRVMFYPYPDAAYLIPYTYISNAVAVSNDGLEGTALVEDDDQPTMPLRYRHAIVLHALKNWYRDKRDDARSQEVNAEYSELMGRIVNDQDVGTHVQARLQPRMSMYTRHAYRPYSKRGGRRVDINGEFDRFQR